MSKNTEFDSLIGGKVDLPSTINVLKFTAARCKEIQDMKKVLSHQTGIKLAFQKLPKHMRRRVMSHTSKRLPRRLREIHLKQLEMSGMPSKQKRPSRKYRRRPKNLQEEYARRQRRLRWLETHIWHAKRFHMIERWGFRLPDRPCDKAFRACYRATTKHCLIQDISYNGCIEIQGEEANLTENLRTICDTKCGLTIVAKAFRNGNREGRCMIFRDLNEGRKAIGEISFIWKTNISLNTSRTVWIWAHPSFFSEVLNTLLSLFNVTKLEGDNDFYKNTSVTIKDLSSQLNRFRLTGPLANAVLHNTLKPVDLTSSLESKWFRKYLDNDDYRQIFAEQLRFWQNIENISSVAQLSPHIVLSLIVGDPRFNLPKIRTKAVPDTCDFKENTDFDLPQGVSFGPIWDEDVRKEAKDNKLSNAAISDMRSHLLVPGSELDKPGAPVPVTLIQRPGNKDCNLGYSSGWDIILPAGWAQPTWISLIMWGARAGGLRETESTTFEQGEVYILAPDTEAGRQDEERMTKVCVDKFFCLPPNKRTNYNRFAIASPFSFNWQILVDEWCCRKTQYFTVLRDRKQLTEIQNCFKGIRSNIQDINFNANCLVAVKLSMELRGKPDPYSIICLPKIEDVKNHTEPIEPVCDDINKRRRKELRDSHKKLLRKVRKMRRLKRKLNDETLEAKIGHLKSQEALKTYTETMRNLWLPPVTSIRNTCCREIMGFVTKGDFSFTSAKSRGVGYVTLASLKSLLGSDLKNRVLIRNTNTRQYRYAYIDVIVS